MHPFHSDSVIIPTMQKSLHIIVSGRVQLVMYRDFTQRKARSLNLTGTVQNLKDGTVEIYVEGEESTLETFIAKLYKGSVLSRVEDVTIDELSERGNYQGFNILY